MAKNSTFDLDELELDVSKAFNNCLEGTRKETASRNELVITESDAVEATAKVVKAQEALTQNCYVTKANGMILAAAYGKSIYAHSVSLKIPANDEFYCNSGFVQYKDLSISIVGENNQEKHKIIFDKLLGLDADELAKILVAIARGDHSEAITILEHKKDK